MFKIPKKELFILKNKGHYDVKPTLFKPRSGKILYPIKESFKSNVLEYSKLIKKKL